MARKTDRRSPHDAAIPADIHSRLPAWAALHAGLVLGVVWALWHVIAMVEAGQSPAWIAWSCLDMVGTRVLMVWLYNNTGRSVFAVALYHAIANLSLKRMFRGGIVRGRADHCADPRGRCSRCDPRLGAADADPRVEFTA